MGKKNLLIELYSKTHAGLDIIRDLIPAIDDSVINCKKAFRLRPDERTPSAYLYPPKNADDCWHVKDYGMSEGYSYFSPIDLYMWENGYDQKNFSVAVAKLAELYGVQQQLSKSVNRPEIEFRDASPEEYGMEPTLDLYEGIGNIDVSCWGNGVTVEHLEAYGWYGVKSFTRVYGNKIMERKSNINYPIFAQRCDYIDDDGSEGFFYKLYEPLNPDKEYRFQIIGKKPKKNYIYGLSLLRREFKKNGEKKLSEVLLVSGGSDAATAYSRGYVAVWKDSETKMLTESDFFILMNYASKVINIPDIDATGIKMGRMLALTNLNIYTAWLTENDMLGLHDNRGRECKDLRDYCRIHTGKEAFRKLVQRAKCARFWTEFLTSNGVKIYSISRTSLDYFIELNGFYTLKDESQSKPVYIRIDGIKVENITSKAIIKFLKEWMEQQGLPTELRDKILRSTDLPNNNSSTLREIDSLDFSMGTATSQYFHFQNCWIEVSAETIKLHNYTEPCNHYVWIDNIINHSFRKIDDMFTVSTDEGGNYNISFTGAEVKSKFARFVINSTRLYWRKEEEGLSLTEEESAEEQLCLASRIANLGYLLYDYKSESEAWATICLDSTLAESKEECNGRSGKSFYIKAIEKIKNAFEKKGSTINFNDPRFAFDGVTEKTSLIFIDECPIKFQYDFFFDIITGDMRVEEKYKHSFIIPFNRSPKLIFATNFTISRHDPSTEGRMWPQVFSDYYHVKTLSNNYTESRSIRDDFGQNLMGTEYSEEDWMLDISFMIQCVRFYLSLEPENRRIIPPLKRIERREQLAAIGKDFKQWADDFFSESSGHLDCPLKADNVLADFNSETRYMWSPKKFTTHLKEYCQLAEHIKCFNPISITHQKKDGERWNKRDENGVPKTYYYIVSVMATNETSSESPSQEEIPF